MPIEQGYEKLTDAILGNQKAAMEWRSYLYNLLPKSSDVLDKLDELKSKRILTLDSLRKLCKEEEFEGGIYGNSFGAFDRLMSLAHNWVSLSLASLLHIYYIFNC